jgi:hypothetical protein
MRGPGLFKFLYTHNPFYLIGTAVLLYGLRIATNPAASFDSQPLFLPGVLALTMLVMALTAIAIVRLGGVWDDARTIVLSILLIAMNAVTSCDGIIRSHPQTVTAILIGGFFFSVAIWELMIRCLKVTFPAKLRVPFYFILSLIFFYSLLFGPAEAWWPRLEDISASWQLYAFGWLLAVGMLMCLPAIHASRQLFRHNGTPWSWPAYPWSIFVALIAVACLRLYFMTLAFVPEYGWTNPIGLHFYVPVLLAAAVLIFEAIQVESKSDPRGVAGLASFAVAILVASLPYSSNEKYLEFFGELTGSLASPIWITLMMLLTYGISLWVRGKPTMEWVIGGLLVTAGFAGAHETTLTSSVQTVWPLIALVAWQNYLALRSGTIKRWSMTGLITSFACGLLVSNSGLPVMTMTVAQLLLVYSLLIGTSFTGLLATWLRLIAVGLMLTCSTAAVATAFWGVTPGWYVAGYILLLQAIALLSWKRYRWPLLAKTPWMLMPLVPLGMSADYSNEILTILWQPSNFMLATAGICFAIGFVISMYKAGWLDSFANDWRQVITSIHLELKA